MVEPYGITNDEFVGKMGIFEQIFSIVGGIVFAIILTWLPGRMMSAAYVICIGSIIVLGYFYYADTIADKV